VCYICGVPDAAPPKRDETAEVSLGTLLLAGVGWTAIGVEALDEIADDAARRVGVDVGEMRASVRDTVASWRREAERLGERGDDAFDRALERFGLARREELDDLALRVAQLEHRLRLVEGASGAPTAES
jgi:polyhydroxyalkanoate synthesis regulator phasin